MMNAELKAKWVAALRSGEFKQGVGELHDQKADCFCCLGVLCRVMGAEFGQVEDEVFGITYDHVPVLDGRVLSHRDAEELAAPVCKEVGIPDQGALIAMNDGGQSFQAIAVYIEDNL